MYGVDMEVYCTVLYVDNGDPRGECHSQRLSYYVLGTGRGLWSRVEVKMRELVLLR